MKAGKDIINGMNLYMDKHTEARAKDLETGKFGYDYERDFLNSVRNYIYIEDVIKSYLLIAESFSINKFASYNLGTNYFTKTLDLVRLIFKYMKVRPNVVINDSNRNVIVNNCNGIDYDYVPHNHNFVKIYVGLIKTIDWYQTYFDKLIRT